MLINLIQAIWSVILDTAPWILLGLFLSGLIKAYLPDDVLDRHLRGHSMASATKAALIGVPLPLCSCGVLPTAMGLNKQGASKPATVSFLISTPETSVDSMVLTWSLMGPLMTVFRPVAAVLSALMAAFLTLWLEPLTAKDQPVPQAEPQPSSCCSHKSCGTKSAGKQPGFRAGMRYAFDDVFADIGTWLMVGIVAAGIMLALLPEDFFTHLGTGLPVMLLMLVVGVPLYICATASTPLAASMLATGMAPGAVLVFLLVGPATNIAGMAIIYRQLGARTLVAYLAGIVVVALGAGLILDALWAQWGGPVTMMMHHHDLLPYPLQLLSAALMLMLLIKPLRQKLITRL